VLDISPEQSHKLETDRLIAMHTQLTASVVSRQSVWQDTDTIRKAQVDDFMRCIEEKWKWYFVPNKVISWAQVVDTIRRIKMAGPLDVVFIDLFDRLTDMRKMTPKSMPYEIGYLLEDIAAVAEKERVHICLLVQIHRMTDANRR